MRISGSFWILTEDEISEVIKNLTIGKAPGSDGLTAEFFKCYSSELTPLLKDMYEEAFERQVLQPTLYQALISVILKKGKNPTDCSSYWPISLIPLDIKIFSKILANCLQKVISALIHPDQALFKIGTLLIILDASSTLCGQSGMEVLLLLQCHLMPRRHSIVLSGLVYSIRSFWNWPDFYKVGEVVI